MKKFLPNLKMIELSIVIVNFNTQELLRKCLFSIFETAEDINLEVIVIDNGSRDGSTTMAQKEFPQVRLIESKDNLGFAKANNIGIKQAQGNYILLLNSDTIVSPGSLNNLLSFVKSHKDAGIAAPKLLNRDGSVQLSVRKLPTLLGAIREYIFKKSGSFNSYEPKGKSFSEVELVVGAAILIPKTVFDEVGLLDERYFMYFEDLEFCRRMRTHGFKVYYLPQTTVFHLVGVSGKHISSQTHRWLIESSKLYYGTIRYYLLTFILFIGQKWCRLWR